ncbi:MAG TPA: amidohydrolase family protein [Sphingomicrobium sp.]|nr:amidohydrolase family protein [Sphingomicrobium sp.]
MRRLAYVTACLVALCGSCPLQAAQPPARSDGPYLFDDAHFHLTNYVQKGLTAKQYVAMMGTKVKRSTMFGIPLQQMWSYSNSGDFAPTYYLQTDAPLYYYSFTDAVIASEYLSLPPADRARLDPMITGFNPADMYAVDHIERVLKMYPGVFSGIGEFSIHKEFVSSKVAGEVATLPNPALDRILDLAGSVGLAVIFHNDIDMPFTKGTSLPIYYTQMLDLLARHPTTTVIWAHTGLGRVVQPTGAATVEANERAPTHIALIERILADPKFANVYFDISWDELAKYAVANPDVIARTAALFDKYPDRFLFGTDNVAPTSIDANVRVFHLWDPVFAKVRPATKQAILFGNYERIFDAARVHVREWEKSNVR